jgi:hypothetical protein
MWQYRVLESGVFGTDLGTVTFDVSLDGGANWHLNVDRNQLLDGTGSPFNGVGDNAVVRINMTTTDNTVSPVVSDVTLTTVQEVTSETLNNVIDKVNEIIAAFTTDAVGGARQSITQIT